MIALNIELPFGIVKSGAYSLDVARAEARLHELKRSTRLSVTVSLASAYANLPEPPKCNLMLYGAGAGVPDERHDFDPTQLPHHDNRTDD